MRVPILFLFVLVAHGLCAQEVTIRNVSRARAAGWVFVDNGWVNGTDLVEVKFGVKSETPSAGFPMKWGFFDADKKLLGKFQGLPRLQARPGAYQSLPETLTTGQTYAVCFPIPPSMATGAGRWRTFLIELGSPPPARAIYPVSGKPEDFQFDAAAGKPELGAADIKPVIKRISRYRNGLPASVNGHWVSGLNTLRVTVQVDSGAEANDFYARVYFFDADRKRIFDWQNPPQVAVKAGGLYTTLPGIWKNAQSYDLHFPIPAKYDQGAGQWRTAVVLFGDKKAVVAESYPAAGKAGDFDFPEKERTAAAAK
jgi:hypothetical protein